MTFLVGGGALAAAVEDGMSGDKRGGQGWGGGEWSKSRSSGMQRQGEQCGRRRRMDRRGGRMGIRRDKMKGKSVEREFETKEEERME